MLINSTCRYSMILVTSIPNVNIWNLLIHNNDSFELLFYKILAMSMKKLEQIKLCQILIRSWFVLSLKKVDFGLISTNQV